MTTAFLRADRLIAPLKVTDSEAGLWHLIGAGKSLLYVLRGSTPPSRNEPPLPTWQDRRALIRSNYELCVGHLAKNGLTSADMWWKEFPSPPDGTEQAEYKKEVLDVIRRLSAHPDAVIARFGADALPHWEKI